MVRENKNQAFPAKDHRGEGARMRTGLLVLTCIPILFLSGCVGLPIRPDPTFYDANIKKIEVRLLRFNFYDMGYYGSNNPYVDRNRAGRDSYDLYEKQLKNIICDELETKGYLVSFGEPLLVDVKAGFWAGVKSVEIILYSALEPKLKEIEKRDDIDVILVFVMTSLYYRWGSRKDTFPKSTSPDWGYGYVDGYSDHRDNFETEDITALDTNYYLYNPALKKRILANQIHSQRTNKKVSEQHFGSTVLVRWTYTETEDELLERCISELFNNIPEYGEKK